MLSDYRAVGLAIESRLKEDRRCMAEILLMRRKTLSNQSINQSVERGLFDFHSSIFYSFDHTYRK